MRLGIVSNAATPTEPRPSSAACRGLALVEAMTEQDPTLELIGFGPEPAIGHLAGRIAWRRLPRAPDPVQALADGRIEPLDALLILDPLGLLLAGGRPPARSPGGVPLLAVIDDLGRVRGPEGELSASGADVVLRRLGRYDIVLATSAPAGEAGRRLLGLPPDRVFHADDTDRPTDEAGGEILRGIARARRRSRPPVDRRVPGFRPRLAIVSPWPPKRSGIADYATRLARALGDRYAIDLVHEPGYLPEPALRSGEFGACDVRSFPRRARVLGYRGVLHQMGNSPYHGFVYEAMLRHPGLVTLHDFCLSGLQFWRVHQEPGDPLEGLRRLLERHYPDRFAEFDPQLRAWTEEPGGFAEALARRGLAVNRDVFEAAVGVVVHSGWCAERARRSAPRHADRAVVVPHGATVRTIAGPRRLAIRDRFDLPRAGMLVGVFGILSPGKMNAETIEAFGRIHGEFPDALLVFVGADWEDGAAGRRAEELGIGGRVRFLGRQPEADYQDLVGSVDVGVSLRRPPTHGETSGALLDLLRHGVPTIVNEAGTFGEYPDEAVRRIDWGRDGVAGLAGAIAELLGEPTRRHALGEAARSYVRENHAWPLVAARYADVIERAVHGELGLAASRVAG